MVEIAAVALVLARTGDGAPPGRRSRRARPCGARYRAHRAGGGRRTTPAAGHPARPRRPHLRLDVRRRAAPPARAAAVAVVVQAYVWLRAGDAERRSTSTCSPPRSVVLACAAAGAVVAAGGGLGAAVIPAALLAYTAVNSLLIAGAVALSTPAPRDRGAVRDVDDNIAGARDAPARGARRPGARDQPVAGPARPAAAVRAAPGGPRAPARTGGDHRRKTALLDADAWAAQAEGRCAAPVATGARGVLVLDLDHFKRSTTPTAPFGRPGPRRSRRRPARRSPRPRPRRPVRRRGVRHPARRAGGQREADLAAVAERIRRRIAALRVDISTAGGPGAVRSSPSPWAATHPGGRGDLCGLLQIADTALYSAKRAGRDLVRMSPRRRSPPLTGS